MNKFILIISCFTILFLSSCTRQIDIMPISATATEDFYKVQEDFIEGANAVYSSLRTYPDRLINLSESRSDNLYAASVLGTQPYDDINAFRRSAVSNGLVDAAWKENFNGIFRANTLLEQIEENGGVITTVGLRDRLRAEVRFLRAFFYFDLVRYFGKVPVVTKTVLSLQADTIPRSPVAEVYKQIIEDLEYARVTLPPTYTGVDIGRATKHAAQSLLAMVYMAKSGPTYGIEGPGLASGEWTKAASMIDSVMKSNVFAFNTSYSNVFSYNNQNPSTNKEAIFDVMYISGQNPVLGASFVTYTIPDAFFTSTSMKKNAQLGGPGRPTSNDLYNTYEGTDVRRTFNFLMRSTTLGIPGIRPYLIKYMDSTKVPTTSPTDWGMNFMAIRYTDVLLLKAECILQGAGGGTQSQADSIVNLVRRRAGLGNISGVTLARVYDERRRELVGEGSRWFDLQRSGNLVTTMNTWAAKDDDLKQIQTVTNDYVIYPVPQYQLDAKPGLYMQNKGYN